MPKESSKRKLTPSKTKADASPTTYDLASINLAIGTRVQLITEQSGRPQQYFATLIGFAGRSSGPCEDAGGGRFVDPVPEKRARHSASFQRLARLFVRKLCRAGSSQSVPLPVPWVPVDCDRHGDTQAMRVKVDIPAQATPAASGEPLPAAPFR